MRVLLPRDIFSNFLLIYLHTSSNLLDLTVQMMQIYYVNLHVQHLMNPKFLCDCNYKIHKVSNKYSYFNNR